MPLLNTVTTPYAEAFLQVASSRNEDDKVVEYGMGEVREKDVGGVQTFFIYSLN